MMANLEKISAGKPLYQAVSDSILERIRGGEWEANQLIPSESRLSVHYEVGRNTVRHAIADLTARGILKTIQGVGSFVVGERVSKTAEYLLGFTQEMQMQGKRVSSKVLDARLIPADPFLARRLQIQLGGEVVYLSRVRLMDGEATALERAHLPHEFCPGILDHDFSVTSLYQVLADEYGCRPDHAEQEIEASLATPQVAGLLGLKLPAVVFVFHRETRLADGRVIEYVDSEVRADQFRFYTNLKLHAPVQEIGFRRLPLKTSAAS
ncbi:MAG TPA: GntR family transcriptional regulator [Anaerolineales bacterium]|jgi:GntR family transcriptional regulator|nr:GntR family transcriptional regulator [Anaerolineales bacterium]